MKILVTTPQGHNFDTYFGKESLDRLSLAFDVKLNPHHRHFTRDEFLKAGADADVIVTHWGSGCFDAEALEHFSKLKLIAHAAGSVANYVTAEVYERGINVISANTVMAKFVAEGALAYMLAACHRIPQLDRSVRVGEWNKMDSAQTSILGADIGFVGLGTVGRNLLRLLEPFGGRAYIYDPYIAPEMLRNYPNAELCSLDTAMSKRFVTLHAAKTSETYHMINAEKLALLPDGAILVNTSRGANIDTAALVNELKRGRIFAALDVYENEGAGKVPKELTELDSATILQPHSASIACQKEMFDAIADDIIRFISGEVLTLTISRRQWELMTKE